MSRACKRIKLKGAKHFMFAQAVHTSLLTHLKFYATLEFPPLERISIERRK